MGAYLNKPITAKDSSDGVITVGERTVRYGVTAMQGWRIDMEDDHCVTPQLVDGVALLAVFDGHGGKEVAMYCSRNIPSMLVASAAFKAGDYDRALKDVFMECDRLLLTEEAVVEMQQLLKEEEGSDSDTSDEDTNLLMDEAEMPLDQILARYGRSKLLSSIESRKGESSKDGNDKEDQEEGMEREKEVEKVDNNGLEEKDKKFNGVKSVLMALADRAGVDLEFEDSSSEDYEEDDDEEVEEEEEDEKEEVEEQEVEKEEKEEDRDQAKETDAKLNEGEEHKTMNRMSCGDNEEQDEKLCSSSMLDSKTNCRKRKRETDQECDKSNGKLTAPRKKRAGPILQEINRPDEGYQSGTTAIVCLVKEDKLIVANTGDSRCVLSCGGKAVDMSVDHNPTDEAELLRIEHAGGSVGTDLRVNGGLNLSRAIGDHFYKENNTLPLEDQMITAMPDVRTRTLTADDEFIVIACDGIWNVKDSQAVVDFVHKKIKPAKKTDEGLLKEPEVSLICEQLCDSCLAVDTNNDGTGCDNMTCIIALLKPFATGTH